jgi:hypothetical protein
MKILAIGNSFSEDATKKKKKISQGELYVRNLYIGGCSLERHMECLTGELKEYDFQKDGKALRKISLQEALRYKDWDYITVQQVSGLSGIEDSYEPFLGQLITHIKQSNQAAKIILHRTWAYEHDSTHQDFIRYDNKQEVMFEKILKASEHYAKKYDLPIIPAGDAIQKLRTETKEFDYLNGGSSLCRDGYHLTLDYGRYAAALIWYRFFKGESKTQVSYTPRGTKRDLIELIQKTV